MICLLLFSCDRGASPPAWTSAWPVDGGGWAVEQLPDNWRMVGTAHIGPVSSDRSCGDWTVLKTDLPALGLAGPGPAQALPTSPAVAAPILERAAWRMAELVPSDRLVLGQDPKDPSRHHGLQVGSLRKTRRSHAPPVYLGAAARDGRVIVTLLDQAAETVLTHLIFPVENATVAYSLPVTDITGDGQLETVIWSDAPPFRALVHVDLAQSGLILVHVDVHDPVRCP